MSHVFRPRADLYPDLPRQTQFSTNSIGLRGPDLSPEGDEIRILAIGGSTTECLMHDDAKVWTVQVGELLGSRAAGRRVWVGNAGRSGMNSRDHVLHAKHLIAELPRLDTALVFVGVNDVVAALGNPQFYTPLPEDLGAEAEDKATRRAFSQVPGRLQDSWDYERSFLAKSQIYQLVKRIRRQRSRALGNVYHLQDDNGDDLPDLGGALATYRANLTRIARIAKERGVALVLMTQPTLWRADMPPEEQKMLWMGGLGDFQAEPGHEYYSPAALAEAMRRFNEAALDVCREQGLSCIDLAAEVPKDKTIFYDDCHFGQTGAARIAEVVAAHLAKQPPFARGERASGREAAPDAAP